MRTSSIAKKLDPRRNSGEDKEQASSQPANSTESDAPAAAQPEERQPDQLPLEADISVAKELRVLLDGNYEQSRQSLRESLNHEGFFPRPYDPYLEQCESTLANLSKVAEFGVFQTAFRDAEVGNGDSSGAIVALENLAMVDGSLAVKAGVQWGLWGGAIDQLGTERHASWVRKAASLECPGCFAMTELGHGSNVQNLETTATYDPETKEFVIHTPSPSATKNYIGNAGLHGKAAVVFAQLFTPGGERRSHGVHALIVELRDDEGNPKPGVTLGHHGHKGGLLGVDNGTISFNNVRVPRENLLNRFAEVDEDGKYSSPIESRNGRFFTMLGTLIRGRIAVAGAAAGSTRAALDLAVRYALRRRQFAGATGQEKHLMEHRSHRRRLLIPLARTYALALLQNQVTDRYQEQMEAQDSGDWDVTQPTEPQMYAAREMESLAAALKVASTDHANRTIQECREACGGAGYMSENRLTTYRADADVFATFEGDNTVLVQMVGKNLLTAYAREMNNLSPWDIVKFAANTAGDVVSRRSGFTTRLQSMIDMVSDRGVTKSLFDADYQAHLIDYRAKSVLNSLVRRIQAARKQDQIAAAATVDKAQDHMINAGWARIDSLLIQALIEAESQLPEGSQARQVFEQVRHLFFFSTVVDHAGWYQEHNLLPGGRIKAARAAVNDLVDSLAPWAEVLVDALGVPSEVRNVPMLNNNGVDGAEFSSKSA